MFISVEVAYKVIPLCIIQNAISNECHYGCLCVSKSKRVKRIIYTNRLTVLRPKLCSVSTGLCAPKLCMKTKIFVMIKSILRTNKSLKDNASLKYLGLSLILMYTARYLCKINKVYNSIRFSKSLLHVINPIFAI